MSAPAQLDAEILARERRDVGQIGHASASLAVCEPREPIRVVRRDDDGALSREALELAVEQRRAVLVERGERLVQDEQVGVVEQRPAQREPLRHATRVRRHALVPRLPEREALEQHPDALAPLRNAIEPSEELEVLDGRELAIDERLVREVADPRPITLDEKVAPRRCGEPREQPEERRLPAAVRSGDDGEPAARHGDVDTAQHALAAVPLLDAAPADHPTSTSSATNPKNTTLITPFSVKNAASSRRRSPGRTMRVLVDEQRRGRDDAEPVEERRRRARAGCGEEHDRAGVEDARADEDAALAEAHGPRVQSLRAIVIEVEERVEEVEAGDPQRDGRRRSPTPPTAPSPRRRARRRPARARGTRPSQRWQSHVTRFRYG